MRNLLLFFYHLSIAKLYVMVRYALVNAIKERVTLTIHNCGLSKYPQAIALSWEDDPLDKPSIEVGSIVRYPTGMFYKVTELIPGVHIRFIHVDDIKQTEEGTN